MVFGKREEEGPDYGITKIVDALGREFFEGDGTAIVENPPTTEDPRNSYSVIGKNGTIIRIFRVNSVTYKRVRD